MRQLLLSIGGGKRSDPTMDLVLLDEWSENSLSILFYFGTCTYDHSLTDGPKDRTPSGPTIRRSVVCDEINSFIIEHSRGWSPIQIDDEIYNFVIKASPDLKPKWVNHVSVTICDNITPKTSWINQFLVVIR
jgi:hypothetical protein